HWIHGTEGNPLTTLARQLGLPTLFVGGDSTHVGGWEQLQLSGSKGPLAAEEKHRSILLFDEIREALEALRQDAISAGRVDISVGAALRSVLEGKALSDDVRAVIDWHLALLARDDWAAGADNLSLQFWDEGYEVYGYGDSVLGDGMQALAHCLAAGLDIRFGVVVERIEYDRGVRIVTSRGSFEAEAAIVTLPLGVLKSGSVVFDPPLPERKRAAIERLGVGTLAKVMLWFSAPFWQKSQYSFGRIWDDVSRRPTTIESL